MGTDVTSYLQLEACEMYFLAMYEQVGNVNPYALDYPVCLEDASSNGGVARANGRGQRSFLMNNFLDALSSTHTKAASADTITQIRKQIGLEPVDGYEPCAESYMTSWINQDSVKQALHVTADNKGVAWADCSRSIRYV